MAGKATAVRKKHTTNVDAYHLYLKGRYHWNRGNTEAYRKAIEHFRQAIAEDPNYALAHTGLADAYASLGDAGCSAGLPEADSPPAGAYRQVLLAAGTVTGTEYPPGLFAADGRVAVTFTTAGGPVLVTCETPACEAPVTTSLGEGGIQSAAFTADGTPVLAVAGGARGGPLELVRCDGRACPAQERVTLADDVPLWVPPAIALDPSGAPAVAFQDLEDFHLSLVRCDGPACGDPAITRLEFLAEPDGTRWLAGSIGIVIGADDRPLLLISSGKGELRLVRCGDRACSAADVAVVDGGILGETDTATLTVAPDGTPAMAWYANGTARFARCVDGACTTWEAVDLGPSIAEFIGAQTPSIAFDGDPIVAYRLAGDAGVALAVCEDPGCADARIVPFGPAGSFRLATDDGLPVLARYARSGEAGAGVGEIAERVEGLLAGAETAVGGGTFGDEERSALAGELRSLADGAGSPAAGLLFEAADAVEGGADPTGELSGVLESLFGELEARDLWLSRCVDPACLGS